MDAMYDVVNESFSCAYDSESSNESANENGINFRTLFKRNKKTLKPQKRSEVAPTPSGYYWDVSSEYFMRALEMRPQTSFLLTASEDISQQHTCADMPGSSTLDSFKSVGDLLTLDEDNTGKTCPMQYLKKRVKFDSYLKSTTSSDNDMFESDEETLELLDINILVVGNHFVGKSALVRRFVHGIFNDEDKYTPPETESKLINLQGRDILLNIIDVSAVIKSSMIEEMSGAIVVFDLNDPKSFASVKKWKKELDSKIRFKIMNKRRIKLPCVLFANKCDSETTFKMCELDSFCSKKGFLAWFDTSSKEDFNVKNGFTFLMESIIETHSLKKETKSRSKCWPTDKKESSATNAEIPQEFSTTL